MANIMIVEDDESMRLLIKTVVVRMGHNTEHAANGQEALDLLDQGYRPDLIVLDLVMPVMDGNAFLDILRTGKYKTTCGRLCCPVLVFSAFPLGNVGFTPIEPVVATLIKPASVPELEAAVQSALERSKECEDSHREELNYDNAQASKNG